MSLRVGDRHLKTLAGAATRPTASRVREAIFNIWQSRVWGCRWLDLCAGSGAIGAEAILRGADYVVGIEQSGAACQLIKQNWQKVSEDRNYNAHHDRSNPNDHDDQHDWGSDRLSLANQNQPSDQTNLNQPDGQSNQLDQQSNSQPWRLYRGDVLKVLPRLIKQAKSNQRKDQRDAIAPDFSLNSNSNSTLASNQHDRLAPHNSNHITSNQALPKLALFDLVYFDPPYQSNLYLPVLNLLPDLLSQNAIVAAEHNRHQPLPDRVGRLEVSDRRSYGSTGLTFYTLTN
jgi:16S rRNA G966 N2-methylase RsmD